MVPNMFFCCNRMNNEGMSPSKCGCLKKLYQRLNDTINDTEIHFKESIDHITIFIRV